MQLAEPRLGLVRRRAEGGAVGDVELEEVNSLGFGLRLLDVVVADVRRDHVHAGAGEDPGHAEPDPARAAGDERGPALKIAHSGPLLPMPRLGQNVSVSLALYHFGPVANSLT